MHLWTIGGLSREVGLSVGWIRVLEGRGIVRPMRDQTGRRLYTDEHIQTLQEYRKRQGRVGVAPMKGSDEGGGPISLHPVAR